MGVFLSISSYLENFFHFVNYINAHLDVTFQSFALQIYIMSVGWLVIWSVIWSVS